MIPPPDDERTAPRPPLTPLPAVMLAFIGLSLQLLVMILVFQVSGALHAATGIGAIVGYGVAFMLAMAQLPGDPAATLGFRGPRPRSWVAALLFLPSQLLTSELQNVISARWPTPPPAEGAVERVLGLAATLELALVVVLVLPLVSEIFFRGLLQPRLAPHWGSLGAVFGVALLAAVGSPYFQLRTLPILLGAALLAGLLRRSSGSIYPGLLLSMSFGVTYVLAAHKVFGIPGFDLIDVAHTPLSFLVVPAAMTGIGLALCRGDASLTREDVAPAGPPGEPPS